MERFGLRIKNTSDGQQAWFSVHLELFGTNKNTRILFTVTVCIPAFCGLQVIKKKAAITAAAFRQSNAYRYED